MTKISKVIHISDIHVPSSTKRHVEYNEQLSKLIEECKALVSEYDKNEVRIVITGDITHNKLNISNEQLILLSWFLTEMNKICKVILISGNHDFALGTSRLDSITPLIKTMDLKNILYLDMILDYKSGIYVDENIAWCLYSIFDGYNKPDIAIERVNHPDKKFIGLFHGAITGSKTDTGFEIDQGISINIFDGCDAVMCGDIHKRNCLVYKNIKVVYPGSVIQQNFGESVSNHGFLLWDIEDLEYEEYNIESDYGFYKFKINSIEEIEDNTEEFVNF